MDQSPQMSWKCRECGYTLSGSQPPEVCPSCGERCEFIDITCYTPECSGPGRDDRLS